MLEVTLRSTAILCAAWLLAHSIRRGTAATRHLVWHVALVAVLVAPAVASFTPKFVIPGLKTTGAMGAMGATGATGAMGATGAAGAMGAMGATGAAIPGEWSSAAELVAMAGSCALGVWFALGWVLSIVNVRRAKAAPLAWQLELNSLRERHRVAREIRLGIVPGTCSPLAAGLWHAAILLPEVSKHWSADRRRAVLLHEFAHIQRADCRAQLVTQLACALHWFNPLVWIAARHMRSERERACDDAVLRAGARPSIYASHLLAIAREVRPALMPSAALAMARPSELEGRLLAVLAEARARIPARGSRWAVAAALAIITAAAASASTTGQPQADASGSPPRDLSPQYSVPYDVMSRADSASARASGTRAETVLEQSPDPEERQLAALEISAAGAPDAIVALRAALNDPSRDVREKAALGLAFLSGRDVVPALLEALTNADPQVREKAAIGLVLRRDDRAVVPLIAAMGDDDAQVREKAAIALGTSGDARARDVLARALDDPDQQVREQASAGLVLLRQAQRP